MPINGWMEKQAVIYDTIKYPEINLSKKVWLYKERNLMKQREAHTWFNEDIDCSWRKITIVWWTLQQHRFEMGESTYTGIFFNSIYHSTTQLYYSIFSWIHRCRTQGFQRDCTVPFYKKNLSIHGSWCPWGVLEPVCPRYWGTAVLYVIVLIQNLCASPGLTT